MIQEGNARARFLREGFRAYLGKDSEKLIEFGVLPFRGKARKPAPPPPAPETTAPTVPAPDSVK